MVWRNLQQFYLPSHPTFFAVTSAAPGIAPHAAWRGVVWCGVVWHGMACARWMDAWWMRGVCIVDGWMQAMAALAARPPEDFKDHVAQHVAIAGPRLVAMCNSLLAHSASLATSGSDSAAAGGGTAGAGSGSAGSGVGSPGVCEDLADVFPHPCCSKGFTQVLTKLMPSLTLRFTPGPL